jgi:hypothetical protein
MNLSLRLALAACVAAPLSAQSPGLPETYSFVSTNAMVGPEMTVKVNRNGSKELIERTVVPKAGSSNGYHDRVLYDFQAHRLYTVDLESHVCSTQAYTSPYAPSQLDPIGGAKEMQVQIAANPPKTMAVETVNGMRANVVESAEGGMRTKLWLDEKLKFVVKASLTQGSGPANTVFEMRQLSYAPSPAALFTAPTGCTQIAGESNANGGHAEMNVDVRTQTQTRQPGGGAARAGNQPRGAQAGSPAPAASAKDASVGKWEVTAKDGKGKAWKGTLTIGDLDPNQFSPDPAKRNHLCDLNLESPEGAGRGRQTPCLFNPQTKTLTFGSDGRFDKFSYSAVLSPDGKSFVQGSWTEEDAGTGTWSARLSGSGAR